MLKVKLKKMQDYEDKQHNLGILTGCKDFKAIVTKGDPLFPMASMVVELIDYQDEDVETIELLKSNYLIFVTLFQQKPLDESTIFPSCYSKRQLLESDAKEEVNALSP